ncbi:MAG: hypothetical protein Tsb0013_18880 [Phycisphaerales bacterium]
MIEQRIWRWAALGCVAFGTLAFLVRTGEDATATGVRVAPSTSVAVLSLGRVLENLDERVVREDELKAEIGKREAALKQIEEQLEQLTTTMDTLTPGSNERAQMLEEAVRLRYTLEFEGNLASRLLSQQRTEMQLALFNKIRDAARTYADAEGFDIVLASDHKAEIPQGLGANETNGAILSRRVLHASDAVDITDAVAQRMNNQFNR